MESFTLPVIILIIIGYQIIASIITYINSPKCKHGIRNGKRFRKGKYKCNDCQLEYEERLQAVKKEEEWKKQRYSIQNLFKECVIDAIKKRKQWLVDDINVIYQLSPSAFEDLVANLYRCMGYEVKQTPYTNDGGKDAYIKKDGISYLVECKRYAPNAHIGRPLLQKLYAAMNEEHIEHGVFITTAEFSKDAFEYGIKYGIQTINGKELVELLREYKQLIDSQYEYILPCLVCGEVQTFSTLNNEECKICSNGHRVNNVFYKNYNNPVICFKCGKKMVMRTGRRGRFYGCSDYPKCRHTISPFEYQLAIGEKKEIY